MKNEYWQKQLRVNITDRKIRVEQIREEKLMKFIGGAGIGAEMLHRLLERKG